MRLADLDAFPPRPKFPIRIGAHRLRSVIKRSGEGLFKWCAKHKLSRFKVKNALDGEAKAFDVEFVAAVEKAAGIDWRLWLLAPPRRTSKLARIRAPRPAACVRKSRSGRPR